MSTIVLRPFAMSLPEPAAPTHLSKTGDIHAWLSAQPAQFDCDPSGSCPGADNDCGAESDTGSSFWVKASMFEETARMLGISADSSNSSGNSSGGSGRFEKQGAVIDSGCSSGGSFLQLNMEAPNICLPRVKSQQRQIYQNWSVLPPVKAPTGTPARPLVQVPLPILPGSTSQCTSQPTSPSSLTPSSCRKPSSPVDMVTIATLAASDTTPSDNRHSCTLTSEPDVSAAGDDGVDHICAYSRITGLTSNWDLANLHRALHRLQISGWYYGAMTWESARARLRHAAIGTFLVRQSSDHRHLFSLSVKTSRGTTSIRLVYQEGFRLDCCDPAVEPAMPRFDCVIALIAHYVRVSAARTSNNWVFYEASGRKDTPVVLNRPLHQGTLTLRQLARKALHARSPATGSTPSAHVPDTVSAEIRKYIDQYPYSV